MNSESPCLRVSRSPCLFCLGGVAAAAAIGWMAAQLHLSGHAPLGILSVGVGLALGVAIGGLAKWTPVASLRQLIVGTVVFALVTVAAEHTWLYRDFRRQWHEARAKEPQVAMFRPAEPWSPREYLAREATPIRLTLWGVDAALVAGAAVGVVLVWQRRQV